MKQTTNKNKRLLRTREASEYTSLSANKLRELGTTGRIPFVQDREGAPWLWDVRDLDGWIERNKRTVPL
jgi:excisionase family DNA binding protein